MVGLGAMMGAGIFAASAPAATAAGGWLLAALALAAGSRSSSPCWPPW
jgi:APA family basic amino acid/polyamine antiporter